MTKWKKYEGYINNQKKFVINFNKGLMQRILSISMMGIISVTTLTGCSISNKEKSAVFKDVSFNSLEEEIDEKQAFVNSVLEEVQATDNYLLKNLIIEHCKNIKLLDDDMDPNNQYSLFLTEEDIQDKKNTIIFELDAAIKDIESQTGYRFGEDFIIEKKHNK